jgi:hypothetical protein
MKSLALANPAAHAPAGVSARGDEARSTIPNALWLLPLHMNLLIIPICAALLALSAPAWADLSRDEAAAAAQRVSGGGRVLAVDRAQNVWRVKVVTQKGEVRVILIDAASGRQV